jgi:hypothetical protein
MSEPQPQPEQQPHSEPESQSPELPPQGLREAADLAALQARVSPTARFIAQQLMPVLGEAERQQLFLLLGAQHAYPPARVRRPRLLALLLDFLAAHDRLPTVSEYKELVAQRRAAGEGVADVGALERAFGGYAEACAAAARLFWRGTEARENFRPAKPARRRGSVTKTLVMDCIEEVSRAIGYWADLPEYLALAEADGLVRAAHGVTTARLVHVKQIEKLFGSYGEALLATQRRGAARARQREAAAHPEPATWPRRGSPRGQSKPRRRRSPRL